MSRITRTVALEDLSDLVEGPANAHVAWVEDGEPQALRVACRYDAGRWLLTLPPNTSIRDGVEAVLLLDEGEFYFELRGLRVRGTLRDAGPGALEVVQEKLVTWDYGTLRRKRS